MSDTKINTLYDLCEEVCTMIKASPFNYYQGSWACDATEMKKNACGTAFCRAGWMCAILDTGKGKKTEDWLREGQWGRTNAIPERAHALLAKAGIPEVEVHRLFGSNVIDDDYVYGTNAYVKAGIDGMRRFMERHKAALQAVKIEEGM